MGKDAAAQNKQEKSIAININQWVSQVAPPESLRLI
jgi:hypothetical protein